MTGGEGRFVMFTYTHVCTGWMCVSVSVFAGICVCVMFLTNKPLGKKQANLYISA